MNFPEWLIDFRDVEAEIWPGDEPEQAEPAEPNFFEEWGRENAD